MTGAIVTRALYGLGALLAGMLVGTTNVAAQNPQVHCPAPRTIYTFTDSSSIQALAGAPAPFCRFANLNGGQQVDLFLGAFSAASPIVQANIDVLTSLLPLQVVFLWFAGGKTAAYLTIPVFLLTEFVTRTRNTIWIWCAVVIPLAIANFITIGSVWNDSAKYLASKIVGDASFTGRTELWQVLLYFTSLNPITGAGFQSFWQLNTDSPALRYGGH